jgi:hypothetical protein
MEEGQGDNGKCVLSSVQESCCLFNSENCSVIRSYVLSVRSANKPLQCIIEIQGR